MWIDLNFTTCQVLWFPLSMELIFILSLIFRLINWLIDLTNFPPMLSFYNSWKYQKTQGFRTFSGGINWNIGWKCVDTGFKCHIRGPHFMTYKWKGVGEGLKICHMFSDSFIFKQNFYRSFLRMDVVGGTHNWSFCVGVINL